MRIADYHNDIHLPNRGRVFAPTAGQYEPGQKVGDDSGDILTLAELQAIIRERENA